MRYQKGKKLLKFIIFLKLKLTKNFKIKNGFELNIVKY